MEKSQSELYEELKSLKNLLTLDDVAAILNVSKRTLYNRLCQKRFGIRYIKTGSLIRVRPLDLLHYLENTST